MSETKSKETLVRLAWLAELRGQGHRQCTEVYSGLGDKVCALGLLREMAIPLRSRHLRRGVGEIAALAGLSEDQGYEVAYRNDGDGDGLTEYHKHTFAEIADVVASWFPNS